MVYQFTNMSTLTRAEEQVMQTLWKLNKAFLGEITDAMPKPKPHSNTVATILKILVEKGFVETKLFGRQHQYAPLISKEVYSKTTMKGIVNRYFEGNFSSAVSFMVREKNLSVEDLELLLKELKKK